MAARFGGPGYFNGQTSRAFLDLRAGAIPGKCPTPVQADFVVRIDNVAGAKFMAEDLALALGDANDKGFSPAGPVGIARPNPVVAAAGYFKVLIDFSVRLISTRCGGVPFALSTLRPFGRDTRSIDPPTRRFRAR